MEFSENGVYIIGAIIGLVLSIPIGMLFGRWSLSYLSRHEEANQITRKSFFCILIFIPAFYLLSICYHYANVTWLIAIEVIVECAALYLYLRHINHAIFNRDNSNSNEQLKLAYISLVPAFLLPGIALGTIAVTDWAMPDVVKITKDDRRFEAKEYYVLPYTHGTRPGGSYIDNTTSDTIYRVIVRYAFLGEELHNAYAVENKYAPGQFARMSSRVNYAMKLIPPIMPPSHNRRGRYHTRRVFLTDGNHLTDFHNLNMDEFGLMKNIRLDYIEPDKDAVKWESPSHYNAYKIVNPHPYPRKADY